MLEIYNLNWGAQRDLLELDFLIQKSIQIYF